MTQNWNASTWTREARMRPVNKKEAHEYS